MFELRKGSCIICGEYRILDREMRCIFCTTKVSGKEIKSKTGRIDDNFWMRGK